jgi:methionyl-tRNA formyltransferase
MKIVFMGTPAFSIPALRALIESRHDVVAVYTKPPRAAGRGTNISKSQVHILAQAQGVPVFTPESLKPLHEIEVLQKFAPDIIVVAAYGLLLRPEVLSIPVYGCVNIHPSSLPRWRGAAPIQRTVMAGDAQTSMCIMQMDAGLDTGAILKQQFVKLDDEITASELHDMMAALGGELLLAALDGVEAGTLSPQKQAAAGMIYADKLTAAEEKINFKQTARLVNCQIRALSPRPGAYFNYGGEAIKVIDAQYVRENHSFAAGTVCGDALKIACQDGFILPKLLQRPGRKMIYLEAFLHGFHIPNGTVLV